MKGRKETGLMLGLTSNLPLAVFLVWLASGTEGFAAPSKTEDVAAQDVSKHAPVRARTPVPTAKRGAPNNWISGKWYHAVSCPAWSGRYIFQIRWRPGRTLKGASKGISFGAKGHSSEIISGKIADGAFEFIERSDKGFIAHYQGSIGPDGSVLSGTYRNTRSGTRCHFVMRRFRM